MPSINLPTPGVTPGPQWAQQLVDSISAVNGEVDGRLGVEGLNSTIDAAVSGLDRPGYDIVLLLGQSNMQGDSGGAVASNVDVTDARIWTYGASGANAGAIVAAADPLAHRGGGSTVVGPGMEFARWYANTLPGTRRVLLVPAAANGTAIASGNLRWDPTRPEDEANLYAAAIAQAQAAFIAAGDNARFAAVLWVQGESDAIAGLAASVYRTYLEQIIDGIRSRLDSPDLPFIIGSMTPEFLASSYAAPTKVTINNVHRDTPSRKAHTAFVQGPSGMGRGDDLHYSPAGNRVQGRRMISGLAAAVLNSAPANLQPVAPPPIPLPTAPGQVSGLAAVAGDGQVSLNWSRPNSGGSPITNYVIQYRTSPAGAWQNVTRSASTSLSATVTSPNGTAYDFRVAAVNTAGTGAYSNVVTATPQSSVPAVLIQESFDQTDGPVTVADTGETLTSIGGQWRAASNEGAPPSALTSGTHCLLVADSGYAAHFAQAVVRAGLNNVGLAVRVTDAANFYVALAHSSNGYQLYKMVGGTLSAPLTPSYGPAALAGDVVRLAVSGSTLTLTVNGTVRGSWTDSALSGGTRAGVWANTAAARVDNLAVGGVA